MKQYIKTHKKQLLIIAIVTVLCLAIVLLAMYFTGAFDNYNAALKEVTEPQFSVNEVQQLNGTMWEVSIKGSVQNVIRTTVSGVRFRFYLLDAHGNTLKMPDDVPFIVEDVIVDLQPNEVREYHAKMLLPAKPHGFRAVGKGIAA